MEENQNTERAEEATTPVDVTPDETLASPPIDVPNEADANDDEDVPAALERETQDGSGLENDESELPESDFAGYATDDVEDDK
ncbi:MAG TPA: hypothetical protein PKC73_00265 [Dermatophilaceae bacterium]|mgnify:CR=1 FL=1|jgi:hypothetical protein|nr:hypothetical protein [Dermatophilaceae bacterium]HOA03191.1 hypothetical protein [Dermatophilaceae bacterium]